MRLFFMLRRMEYDVTTFFSRKILTESVKVFEKNIQLYTQPSVINVYICVY